MNLIRKNHYDEGLRAMLRVSEPRSAGTRFTPSCQTCRHYGWAPEMGGLLQRGGHTHHPSCRAGQSIAVGALTTNAKGEKIVSFPAWIFGGIVGFGLLGGAAAAYFEHKAKVGWDE